MREIVIEPREQRSGDVFVEWIGEDDPRTRRYVRVRRDVPPIPALPLAHGSVVYAEIGEHWAEWFLTHQGTWIRIGFGFGGGEQLSSSEMHDRTSRFHLISEPRLLTIQEVLARARAEAGPDGLVSAEGLAREFEIEP